MATLLIIEPLPAERRGGGLIYRQRRPVRLWHWINALTVIAMLMTELLPVPWTRG